MNFNNYDVPFSLQQMQIIAFNDRNTVTGLGSATIYLFVYFGQCILVLILKIVIKITGERYIK